MTAYMHKVLSHGSAGFFVWCFDDTVVDNDEDGDDVVFECFIVVITRNFLTFILVEFLVSSNFLSLKLPKRWFRNGLPGHSHRWYVSSNTKPGGQRISSAHWLSHL